MNLMQLPDEKLYKNKGCVFDLLIVNISYLMKTNPKVMADTFVSFILFLKDQPGLTSGSKRFPLPNSYTTDQRL